MNILHVNNNHFILGGAATYYFITAKLMEEHGHKSVFFSMHSPKNQPSKTSEYFMPYVDLNADHGIIDQLKIAGRILYSLKARKLISRLLDDIQIDVAHLHNIYHGFSPSILYELKKRNIPIVMTLHNYKLVCGSYILLIRGKTHGEICEACSGGKYYMTCIKKCVKNSYKKSLLTAVEMYLHHDILDSYSCVDVFISPSIFLKNKLKEMGFKKEIVHMPYFIDTDKLERISSVEKRKGVSAKRYILYAGRLAVEKGLCTLLDAVKLLPDSLGDFEIRIAGEGPMKEILMEKIKKEQINHIRFIGYLDSDQVYKEMSGSIATVLPSEWYDNYPMAIIETFAMGVPLIGARIGGIPEMVIDNETGLTFESGNAQELSEKIGYIINNPEAAVKMGERARKFVVENLNADEHYRKLMDIYNQAIRNKS